MEDYKRDKRIKRACPICRRLTVIQVYACSHEDTCSVDYLVQCLGDCVSTQGKKGFFSPSTDKHYDTEKKAIAAWNKGEIVTERKIGGLGNNWMGD